MLNDDVIVMKPADSNVYGITYKSAIKYDVTGKGVYNRNFPHGFTVWSNVNRPNPTGKTRYLGPDNEPTDSPTVVTLDSGPIVIDGRSYGLRGQVEIGQTVELYAYSGTKLESLGKYEIQARRWANPIAVPVEN